MSELLSQRSLFRNLIAQWLLLKSKEVRHSLFPPPPLRPWHECHQAQQAHQAPSITLGFLEMGCEPGRPWSSPTISISRARFSLLLSGLLTSSSAFHSLWKAGLQASGIQPQILGRGKARSTMIVDRQGGMNFHKFEPYPVPDCRVECTADRVTFKYHILRFF